MYYFKVHYYLESDVLKEDKGFLAEDCMSRVLSTLMEYYDEVDVKKIELETVSDCPLLYCENDEIAKTLMEENNL